MLQNSNGGCSGASNCNDQPGCGEIQGNGCNQNNCGDGFKGQIKYGPLENITLSIDKHCSIAYKILEKALVSYYTNKDVTNITQILTTNKGQKTLDVTLSNYLADNAPTTQQIKVCE